LVYNYTMPPRQRYRPRSVRRLEKKAKRNLILSIIIFLIFAYFLITWGLPTLIGGLTIFNKFKPAAQVEEIEDTGLAPPVLNIPFEATNSADLKISGYATEDSQVEIYFDDSLKDTVDTSIDGSFETGNLNLIEGTNYIHAITKNGDKKSLPSKTIKLLYSKEEPKLEVSEPPDNHQIKGGDKKVKVSGSVDNQNPITINGTTVIVNAEGNFSTEISLNEGDNTVTIIATNNFGNSKKIEKKVTYNP